MSQVEGPDQRPFFGSVGFMLSQLGYVTSRRFAELLAPFQLEPRQFAMLRYIASREGGSQQAIGEALQIPASRMVALVDDLEGRGLLERRANPNDRRTYAVYLTPAGHALCAEALAVATAHEQRITEALTPAQRTSLLRLLNRVAADLGLGGVHPDLRRPDPQE